MALRSLNGGINPPLKTGFNKPRQPYYYNDALLEIPSHGWHDTAFSGNSLTPLNECPPGKVDDVLDYYRKLFEKAYDLSKKIWKILLVSRPSSF